MDRRFVEHQITVALRRSPALTLLSLLLLAASARTTAAENAASPNSTGVAVANGVHDVFRVTLHDGDVMLGRFAEQDVTVVTEFGSLHIPFESIRDIQPGLLYRPELKRHIGRCLEDLASESDHERTRARQALQQLGPPVRRLLEQHRDESNARRADVIQELLAEFNELQTQSDVPPAALIDEDTIRTANFTVVGRIVAEPWRLQTKYGGLTLPLADIGRIQSRGEYLGLFASNTGPLKKERELLKKASVDGKYKRLLRKFEVPQDVSNYGEFSDYGHYGGTSHAGYNDLPPGFWVYVYPHWYIWGEQVK